MAAKITKRTRHAGDQATQRSESTSTLALTAGVKGGDGPATAGNTGNCLPETIILTMADGDLEAMHHVMVTGCGEHFEAGVRAELNRLAARINARYVEALERAAGDTPGEAAGR